MMTEEKLLAESSATRLVCNGVDHRGVDKRTGASYRLRECDCNKETKNG
jgi:hypothetical protein